VLYIDDEADQAVANDLKKIAENSNVAGHAASLIADKARSSKNYSLKTQLDLLSV